jgi:hypothetical protein
MNFLPTVLRTYSSNLKRYSNLRELCDHATRCELRNLVTNEAVSLVN